jgi:hypothetical protein
VAPDGLCYYGNHPLCFPGSRAAASFSDWHSGEAAVRALGKWGPGETKQSAQTHTHSLAPCSLCLGECPTLSPFSL